MQTIRGYAFSWCKNLKSVAAAEGSQLREIGIWAFDGCKNLKSVTIPAATKVHPGAFKSSVCVTRK